VDDPNLTTTLIPTGVDRDRLVRVLQTLFGNAEQPAVQKPPSEPETTPMKGPSSTQPPTSGSPAVPPLADAPPPDFGEESLARGTSSKAGTREGPGSGPELSRADTVSGSSIEQLREIIFGEQLREYERRFARMEARLATDLAEIREEVRARFTALEQHVRNEFESVAVELRATQQSRAVEERRLSEAIIDAAKEAEDRFGALNDLVTRETRDLRAQLREQTKAITDDVQRRHAELLELHERDAAELREGKADRTDLSALFMEVAARLRGESVIPEAEESGRG
jgi:hypothetical protein